MATKILPVLLGSLLFQIIQLGCFPILIGQILVGQEVSKFLVGLILAIPWLSVLLFGALVPALIRRVGSHLANGAGFLFTLAGILLILVDESLWVIVLSTICVGIGLIIRWVNCDTLVIELSDAHTSGRAIGIHEALMGLGLALGPLLFAVASLGQVKMVCLGLAFLGQLSFWFTAGLAPAGEQMDKAATTTLQFFRLIAIALAAAFVAGFVESSATALFPIHFGSFGFSLSASAILVSSFGFGGTLLQPPLGTLADRKGYDYVQLLCAVVILLCCVIMVIWPKNQAILLMTLFIFGGAVGGLNTLAVMEAGKVLTDTKIPAAMTAIAMLYTLGGVVGPITAASSLDILNNFGMIVLFASISLILVGFLAFLIRKTWMENASGSNP